MSYQYPVFICDPSFKDEELMSEFIKDSNLSLINSEYTDVSDVSLDTDIIWRYIFSKEEDAMFFALKFKHVIAK